ncbi:MAG: spiro-SPASM protein [Spirochaetales bacterium]|nr:spiro-SPASM protein [Spirochaetales bacterium]
MKNIAIINGIDLSPYTGMPLVGEKTTTSLVHQFSLTLPDSKKQVLLSSTQLKETDFEVFRQDIWNTEELLVAIERLSAGYDNIYYFYADCPFLDTDLSKKMFHNHIKYMADYTFADGYPYGLSTEIIKTDIIKRLLKLNKEKKNPVQRQSIFDILKNDINSFDIETELAPRDQRLLRVQLSADTKRNFSLLKRIASIQSGQDINSPSVCTLLDKQPELLRTLPAFFSIQITGGCPQKCLYCPYPETGKKNGFEITENKNEMEPGQFQLIVHAIKDFCEDAVISISAWGEPALHTRISNIAEKVLEDEKLSLIIETSGIGWNTSILSQLTQHKKNPVKWILSLDAWTNDVYASLRGQGFQEAYKTAETLLSLDKNNVYIQAVRMKENEDDLEHFYLNWQKKTENIIIQKYDSFCNVLPERKVTDLSPLHRFPCWHLKRDMTILIDGSVPLCKEDISSSIILGNIFHDSLPDIWEKGQTYYLDHITGNYPGMCRKCDEYYTFNF